MGLIGFLCRLALGSLLLYFAATNTIDGNAGWATLNAVLGALNLIFAVNSIE